MPKPRKLSDALGSQDLRNLPSPELTVSPDSDIPKYQRLERKEVRIALDQIEELERFARRYQKKWRGSPERITPNTHIRVALAYYLEKLHTQVQGDTEEEMGRSLGLEK